MKKTYMIPTAKVVKIQTVKMIAGSATLGFGDSVTDASVAESRDAYWIDFE